MSETPRRKFPARKPAFHDSPGDDEMYSYWSQPTSAPPTRYTGLWRDAMDKSPAQTELRLQAWLSAVKATSFCDGEDEVKWASRWRDEWLPWAAKPVTTWTREDMLLGKRIYRIACGVTDGPDHAIKPEMVRRLSMIITRRGLRETPERILHIFEVGGQAPSGDLDAVDAEPALQHEVLPTALLTPLQAFVIKRVALARTLFAVESVSEADVIQKIIEDHMPVLIAELKDKGVDILAMAQAQGICEPKSE